MDRPPQSQDLNISLSTENWRKESQHPKKSSECPQRSLENLTKESCLREFRQCWRIKMVILNTDFQAFHYVLCLCVCTLNCCSDFPLPMKNIELRGCLTFKHYCHHFLFMWQGVVSEGRGHTRWNGELWRRWLMKKILLWMLTALHIYFIC